MQREHPIKVTHLKDATDPSLSDHNPQVAVALAHPLECTDHHTEAKRVDKADPRKIEHDVPKAITDRLVHVLSKLRSTNNIDLASDDEDTPFINDLAVHHNIHDDEGTSRPRSCVTRP